jgi:hypothetical protein
VAEKHLELQREAERSRPSMLELWAQDLEAKESAKGADGEREQSQVKRAGKEVAQAQKEQRYPQREQQRQRPEVPQRQQESARESEKACEKAPEPKPIQDYVHRVERDRVVYCKALEPDKQAFAHYEGRIAMLDSKDEQNRRAALALAGERFKGPISIRGSDEYKRSMAETAVQMGMQDRIKNPELKDYIKELDTRKQERGRAAEQTRDKALEQTKQPEKERQAEPARQDEPRNAPDAAREADRTQDDPQAAAGRAGKPAPERDSEPGAVSNARDAEPDAAQPQATSSKEVDRPYEWGPGAQDPTDAMLDKLARARQAHEPSVGQPAPQAAPERGAEPAPEPVAAQVEPERDTPAPDAHQAPDRGDNAAEPSAGANQAPEAAQAEPEQDAHTQEESSSQATARDPEEDRWNAFASSMASSNNARRDHVRDQDLDQEQGQQR